LSEAANSWPDGSVKLALLRSRPDTLLAMDMTPKLLEEIRDILRRDAEERATERAELKQWRADQDARVKLSVDTQVSQAKLYRRVVAIGGVLIVVGVVFIFSMLAPR
jgi:hypothetical protein